MSNFVSNSVNFGQVVERQQVTIHFKKTPDCKKIGKLVAGCGCTVPKDFPDSIMTVFTAGAIAPQTVSAGRSTMDVKKTVTVYFEDGTNETLTLKGTVVA